MQARAFNNSHLTREVGEMQAEYNNSHLTRAAGEIWEACNSKIPGSRQPQPQARINFPSKIFPIRACQEPRELLALMARADPVWNRRNYRQDGHTSSNPGNVKTPR